MRYLLIGIWHGRNPAVHHRKTERKETPEGAAFTLARIAERMFVPDEILVVEGGRGPQAGYHWRQGVDYTQADFNRMFRELELHPPSAA